MEYIEFEINHQTLLHIINNYSKEISSVSSNDQNGKHRTYEDKRIKFILGMAAEHLLKEFLNKEINQNKEFKIIKNFFINNVEYSDLIILNEKYSTCLSIELRTSFCNNHNINNQDNLTLIGKYINNVKKYEPQKDFYFQMIWQHIYNESFKKLFYLIENNKTNQTIKIRLPRFAVHHDFKQKFKLNQSNTEYYGIRPIKNARKINTLHDEIKKTFQTKHKNSGLNLDRFKKYFEKFQIKFSQIYINNNEYLLLINKYNNSILLNFDINDEISTYVDKKTKTLENPFSTEKENILFSEFCFIFGEKTKQEKLPSKSIKFNQ